MSKIIKFFAVIQLIGVIKQIESFVQNESILFVYDSEITLTCNLTRPVNFFVNGFKANENKYEISDTSMRIKKLKKLDILSSYFCNNSEGDQINFYANISPRLFKMDFLSYFGVKGNQVNISCYALLGYQNNLNIEWIWIGPKGESMNSTERFKILDKNERSNLIIHESIIEDSGIYECIGKNAYGSHSRTVKLVIKSNLAPLWPFIGTIGQFVILILILIYHQYRGKKL